MALIYRRFTLVSRLIDLQGGLYFNNCPCCAMGPCTLHVDGNSKMYTFERKGAKAGNPSRTSGYTTMPGGSNIMIPDRWDEPLYLCALLGLQTILS